MTATSKPLLERRDVAVLVPAAGQGVRLGANVPKALHLLAGESLLTHCIRALTAAPSVALIVIAAPPGHTDSGLSQRPPASSSAPPAGDAFPGNTVPSAVPAPASPAPFPAIIVVEGGRSRQESVSNALAAVPPDLSIVLVHDAA